MTVITAARDCFQSEELSLADKVGLLSAEAILLAR